MCLAIFKPENKQIKKRYLEAGFNGNSDGAGFAYIKDKRIVIEKGFFNFAEFWVAYEKIDKRSPMLIHFRWATHGKKDAQNCHPFELLAGRGAMIHNGILPYESTATKSDTACFVDGVLDPLLTANPYDDKHIKYLIENAIGDSNKIACLFSDGNHVIYNEKKGEWHKGSWFSNSGYRTQRFAFVGYSGYGVDEYDDAEYIESTHYPFAQPISERGKKHDIFCRACKKNVKRTWDDFCPECYAGLNAGHMFPRSEY